MQKFLPTSFKRTSGFTLIELMIVIAIIGILAVVVLGIFSGAQGSARDARRQAEIDALAKNIESTRDPVTGNYKYTTALFNKDYPAGLTDPGSGVYCQAGSTSSTANPPTGWPTPPSSCPGSYGAISGTTITAVPGVSNDIMDDGIKGWQVCAFLERSNRIFCKGNIIQ